MASFKLTIWCHWMQTWKEMLIVTSGKLVWTSSNTPLHLPRIQNLSLALLPLFAPNEIKQLFAECAPCISTCILYKLLFCSCYWLNLEKPHTPPLPNWNPNQLLKDSSSKIFLVSTLTYFTMFSFVSCFYKIPNLSIFFPPSRFLISWVQGFVLPPK